MEYVLIGRDGKSHEYLESRDEAVESLCEEERQSPGITDGWVVQAYDEDGNEIGEAEALRRR